MFFVVSKLVQGFLVPSHFIWLIGFLGVLLLFSPWRRGGAGLCAASILMTLFFSIAPLGDMALSKLEDRFPIPELVSAPTGIIMLGGTTDLPVSAARRTIALIGSAERLTETAALAIRFPTARIVLSGGVGDLINTQTVTESELGRKFLVQLGIPESRITIEEKSRSTAENAEYSLALIKPKPGETWLLVTSANHMPRAVGSFRAVGFNVIPYPVDFRTIGHGIDWSMGGGLGKLDAAEHEWIGLVAYWLTGRSSSLFPAP
jgi:uncharacterized SAM-binding protein YcdF (DUF218 family)